jgi:hypothetical protein
MACTPPAGWPCAVLFLFVDSLFLCLSFSFCSSSSVFCLLYRSF